jgi:MFS_1 like family
VGSRVLGAGPCLPGYAMDWAEEAGSSFGNLLYPMAGLLALVCLATLYLFVALNHERKDAKNYIRLMETSSDVPTNDETAAAQHHDEWDTAISVVRVDVQNEPNSSPTMSTLSLFLWLCKNAGWVFLTALTMLSFGQAIVDNLSFLYFEDLGSNYTAMGWMVVLTVVFEIPVFHVGDTMVQRYGTFGLLHAGMVCYIVRVLGYSIVPEGHSSYVLLLEPMHGITYACSHTAAVDFAAQRMPAKHHVATGQGLVYLIRAMGSVLGLLWGGYLHETIGPRMVYRSSAFAVAISSLALAWTQRPLPCQTSPECVKVGHSDNDHKAAVHLKKDMELTECSPSE